MTYYAVRPYDLPTLLTELSERIANTAEGNHWYAMVDAAFDHEGKKLVVPGSLGWTLYHQGQFAMLSGASPTLYTLTTSDFNQLQHQLSRLLWHCQARPMLSFIRSKSSAGDLRDAWQNMLEVETEDEERYLLRFADTRVLSALAVQEQIWKHLTTDVATWLTIGRDGELRDLALPASPEHNENALVIDNDGLSELLEAGHVDAMANYLHENFPESLTARDGAANYALLVEVSALCKKHEINGASEQNALALAVLLTNGHLLEVSGFENWLSEKTWPSNEMEDALADWMEEEGIS